MNKTQIATIATPIIAGIATWLASKFPLIDQATWNTLLTAVFGTVTLAVIGYFTRGTAIIDTAGQQPKTTVITSPEIAASLPNNPDVVAVTPEIVRAVNNANS